MELVVIFVLVWVVCAILAAVFSQQRNRSAAAGFVVGLLFGPLGVLLAMTQRRYDQEAADLRKGLTRRCPACAEVVKAAAVKCRYCGEALPPIQEADTAEQKEEAYWKRR